MTEASGPLQPAGDPALTASQIAVLTGGTLRGDGSVVIRGVAPLNRAGRHELSFLADGRYAVFATDSEAGVLLVAPEFAGAATRATATIVVAKPYDALVALLPKLYAAAAPPVGVHPTAVVSPDALVGDGVAIEAFAVIGAGARLGNRAWIGPHCVVGAGVQVGKDSRLISHVTCYEGSVIGERVILHAGTRIGSDGFGYAFSAGEHKKLLHVGLCIISDDVEIGANSAIDRGSVGDTVIGAGTKIDNLVHVAHNVRIGRLCLLMAQVGVAGSTQIDDGAILAGQSGVSGHVHVGAGARVAARAGVISDVPAGETWSGYPARPHRESLRASAALLKLSGMMRKLERLLERES